MVQAGVKVSRFCRGVYFVAARQMAQPVMVDITIVHPFTVSPGHIRRCRLQYALCVTVVVIFRGDAGFHHIMGDVQAPHRVSPAVAHPGRTVDWQGFTKYQRPLRIGKMHHFCLRVFLEGKPVKYPHLRQQALNKRQVTFLILVYLLALRVALLEVKFIFPAMQVMLL